MDTKKNEVMRFGYIMQLCVTEVVLLDKLGKNEVSCCPTFYKYSNYRAASYFHSTSKKDLAKKSQKKSSGHRIVEVRSVAWAGYCPLRAAMRRRAQQAL
ncbi:MAG: hypothetical protein LBL94_12430 [Prevotellaceae bacterium]|jgi:hypothetical protein|nr:hypothetical protein [Prevotellaceae bacterium]